MISTRPAKARSLLRLAWFLFFITTTLHSAPLKVGAHDKPPFCFKNPDGSWTGLSVEVWKEVADLVTSPKVPAGSALNTATFRPVTCQKLRIVFTHQGQSRSGLTELELRND